jgi:hypothetical protein
VPGLEPGFADPGFEPGLALPGFEPGFDVPGLFDPPFGDVPGFVFGLFGVVPGAAFGVVPGVVLFGLVEGCAVPPGAVWSGAVGFDPGAAPVGGAV